ncbi:unnamed protein product [[Candida] boidinii]|nr:unnamed protein product [[Candida] boidinii]
MNKNGIKVISQNNSKETEDQIASQSFNSSFNGSYNFSTSYTQPNFNLLNEGTPISIYGSQPQILQFSSQMMDSGDQSQKERGEWSQNKSAADGRKAGDAYPHQFLAVKKTSDIANLKDQSLKTPIIGSWSEDDLEIKIRERLKDKNFTDLVDNLYKILESKNKREKPPRLFFKASFVEVRVVSEADDMIDEDSTDEDSTDEDSADEDSTDDVSTVEVIESDDEVITGET